MSRLSKYASKEAGQTAEFYGTAVENFMGGTSFEVSPLQTLRIVAASSIFGEPQYYRDGLDSTKTVSRGMSHREFEIFDSLIMFSIFLIQLPGSKVLSLDLTKCFEIRPFVASIRLVLSSLCHFLPLPIMDL